MQHVEGLVDATHRITGEEVNSTPKKEQVEESHTLRMNTFTWIIKNFSQQTNIMLYSYSFVIDGYKWRVLIFPKGDKVDHLSVYLAVADYKLLPYGWSRRAQFSLAVVNQRHTMLTVKKVSTHKYDASQSDWGFRSFMPLSDFYDASKGFLKNDTCIVQAEVTVQQTEVNGKRKRNDTQSKKQPQQPIPEKAPSPQSGVICVQGYMVKNNIAPVLEAIFKKYGDIAAECVFKPASMRATFLEGVCEAVRRIETSDFTTVISEMGELDSQVSALEAAKINVSWLRAHLEVIRKRKKAKENSILLMETKGTTVLVKKAAQMDLKERCAELVDAQERFVKAERCARVLDLVEKKLSNNILESKAEKDLWVKQPII